MKKPVVPKTSEPSVQNIGVVSRDRRLSNAIENVFRLTHGREMTPDERRLFGFAKSADLEQSGNGNKETSRAGQTRGKRRH